MSSTIDGGRVAVVTGANQGLGLALAAGLRKEMEPEATVYLTGRDPDRVRAAAGDLGQQGLTVVPEVLDVTDDASVRRFLDVVRARHGGVDIVLSNAAARIHPEQAPAEQVRQLVDTNNLGTTRLLRALMPMLRAKARYLVVASSFGSLRNLPDSLRHRFDRYDLTVDDIDTTMLAWADSVEAGTAATEGWPEWINVPSKIGQVAAMRIVAREEKANGGAFVAAACPGLIDTGASRPWFDDMSQAQSPTEAASALISLALDPVEPAFHGELVQFRQVLPWR